MSERLQEFFKAIKNGEILTKVDLSNCKLNVIPEELYMLKDSLVFLNLGNNDFEDLPCEFSVFQRLEILFMPNNKFTKFPKVIGSLKSLFMVSFKTNQIINIPEEALSPSIGWLILTSNKIEKLPNSIGNLPKLRKLMLAGNLLTDLPDTLGNCKNLELIRISSNKLEKFPSCLKKLPKLSWLAFENNPFKSYLDTPVASSSIKHIESNHVESCSHKSGRSPIIPWKDLKMHEKLGEGASGDVFRCTLLGESREAAIDSSIIEVDNDDEEVLVAVKLYKSEHTSDGRPEDEMNICERCGIHPSLITVIGRTKSTEDNRDGLVLSLVPSHYTILGQPPSFSSVTRDVYAANERFSLKFVLPILMGIVSVCKHLHQLGINHGDLYAHNILVTRPKISGSNTTGSIELHHVHGIAAYDDDLEYPPILGDFGAASIYSEPRLLDDDDDDDPSFSTDVSCSVGQKRYRNTNNNINNNNDASTIIKESSSSMNIFSTSSVLSEEELDLIERIEVRAFGCLLEELLGRLQLEVDKDALFNYCEESDNNPKLLKGYNIGEQYYILESKRFKYANDKKTETKLKIVQSQCLKDNIFERPSFSKLAKAFDDIFYLS